MDKEIFLNLLKERILILDGGMRKKDGSYIWIHDVGRKIIAENSLPIGRAT